MTLTQYGWPVSPYSAKTRAYLRFKGADFVEVEPTARQLYGLIQKAVGAMVMPTVRRADGSWLQDTSDIIDTLEGELDGPSITPEGPTQRLAQLLLELHGDEWLPIVSMNSRWNNKTNAEFARTEFARYGMPGLPTAIGRIFTAPIAKKMAGYLPILGVTTETRAAVDTVTKELIARLNTHLAEHPFLLGSRPGIGDFALYGPLWAHVYRDPGTTAWYDEAPHVVAWFDRLAQPSGEPGSFLPNDEVPATLDPIFRTLFEEQMPYVASIVAAIDRYCEEHPDATRVPRSLGDIDFVIGGAKGRRRLITFIAWMAQRPLDAYASDRAAVEPWLRRVGGYDAMQLTIANRQARTNFKMGLER
jgi:glutathione S-transferase